MLTVKFEEKQCPARSHDLWNKHTDIGGNLAVGVNRPLRPSPSDWCTDYYVTYVLIWKRKITGDETGATPVSKKLISDDLY